MKRLMATRIEPQRESGWRLVAETVAFLFVCFAVVLVLSLEAVA